MSASEIQLGTMAEVGKRLGLLASQKATLKVRHTRQLRRHEGEVRGASRLTNRGVTGFLAFVLTRSALVRGVARMSEVGGRSVEGLLGHGFVEFGSESNGKVERAQATVDI